MNFPDSTTIAVSPPCLSACDRTKILENFESSLRRGGGVDEYRPPSETLFLSPSSQEKASEIDKLADLFLILSDFDCDNIKKIYNYLFYLFPYFKDQDIARFFNESLTPGGSSAPPFQKLINYAPALKDQQRDLSLFLALWHKRQAALVPIEQGLIFYSEAMHYFATASNIAKTQGGIALVEEITLSASNILIKIAKTHAESFKEKLERAGRNGRYKDIAELFFQIESLKRLCTVIGDQDFLKNLYDSFVQVVRKSYSQPLKEICTQHVGAALKAIADLSPSENQAPVRTWFTRLVEAFVVFRPSLKTPIERYYEQLKEYRDSFKCFLRNNLDTREFQKEITKQFLAFVQDILGDTFAILGPPPCKYDIRAMGSIAREEATPFSDLELMILVEKEEEKPYFKQLLKIFNLQIISLGETASSKLNFTSLHAKNPSGFHIDFHVNPDQDPELMGTPDKLSRHQNNLAEPGTAAQMVRTSLSLHRNEPLDSLFQKYQSGMRAIFDAPEERPTRHTLAFHILKIRLEDYHKTWVVPTIPPIFNLKTHYIQPLHLCLADIGLYFKIEATNTIDIVDGLFHANIFSKETALLIKEGLSFIYHLRIRTHDYYKQQRDDLCTDSKIPMNCEIFSLKKEDKEQLEKIYWLILRPLYQSLANGLSTETSFLPSRRFESVFSSLDLTIVIFNEICGALTPKQFFPAIHHFVFYLISANKSLPEMLQYFEQLSQSPSNDQLREAFLNTLKSKWASHLTEKFYNIPNRAGLLCSYARNYQQLYAAIEKLTEPGPTDQSIQVKIVSNIFFDGITDTCHRYLNNKEIINKILNSDGNIKQQHPGSAHSVASAEGLYFKQKPTHPLMEFAIHNLFSRLAGSLTPPSELVRFDIQLPGKTLSYPVLISQGIPGPTLKALEASPSLQTLDITRLTWFLLGSLLTRPGDGRLSNYVVKDNLLFCIDNDLSFVEPVTQYRFSKEINFCSALFCLPEQPLSSEVFNQFIHLDRTALLDGWIEDVIAREKQYISLFTPEETERLWSEDPNNRFIPTILFKEGTLVTLDVQFGQLQAYLREQLERGVPITLKDLLKQLINLQDTVQGSVGPIVAKAYSQPADTLGKRLAKAVGRHQEASLTSAQFLEKTFKKIPSTEEVHKKKVFSPEKAREELLHSLFQHPEMRVMQDRENNLSLIGDFTCMAAHGGPDTVRQTFVLKALQFLAKQKQHTTIVLRSCAVLKLATLMPFLQDTLEHLDISYSSNINSSDISEIQKRCPRLKRLHLEGCGQLRNIRYGFFGGFLSFEHLEELSVKNCANLTSLEIKAPRLKYLYAQNTTSLSSVVLDVESFPLIDLKKSLCVDLKINPLENLCRETLSFENAYHFYMYQLTQLELGFPFNKEQVGTTLDRFKGICEYLRSLAHSMRYPEHVLEKIERLYFGRNKWHRYFGLKVTEPPLPPNIREILKSPCPFWPDKIVAETHFLTLIPEDMTLERLESLTQNSQQGNKIGFIYKDGGVWRQHSQTPSGKAHWVLMTNDVIPGSRSKRWEDQQTLAATFRGQGYELPSVIDVATCILLEYVETGHRFYSNTPFTYTQCVEQVRVESSKWPLIIGGFASGGLLVDYSKAGVYDYLGVGVARKL